MSTQNRVKRRWFKLLHNAKLLFP